MKKYFSWKLIGIFLSAILFGFYVLPGTTQKTLLPFLPDSWTNGKIHLGLDLQGGSQLDYKIDLRKVPEKDQADIIDGVKEVIEKRVNGLGLSEANIYISDLADEKHIVVEIAETASLTQEDADNYFGKDKKKVDELNDDDKKIVSLEKAKATVGKTILLEFKEKKDALDPEEADQIKSAALAALEKIKNGAQYNVIGQEEVQAFPGRVKSDSSDFIFESNLDSNYKDILPKMKVGDFHPDLIETRGSFTIDESGQAVENKGLTIIKLNDVSEDIKNKKEVSVAHVLISYSGAENAADTVTRSKDEAKALAEKIHQDAVDGKDFAILAQENSDDAASKEKGGRLDKPVTGDGTYLFNFEEAATAFEENGEISKVIDTTNGYEIIKGIDIKKDVKEKQYKYDTITYSLIPDPWKDTGLTGQHFVHADMQLDNLYQPYVSIQFDDVGAKLFEEITKRNINKQVAIFVGGELISAPRVNETISGGQAQITGSFTVDEAKNLSRDLNTGAIPAPIVLTGEYTIGASLGQTALSQSVKAGLIGFAIIALFMGLYYKISGIMAIIALLIYSTIFLFLIKSELSVWMAILASLILFGYLVSKIVNNRDSGWEKFLSFLLSFVGFFFILHLLQAGVVLTLAGVAGIILSIGMAVDANILIFERFKEEVRDGKNYRSAINEGFDRAWSAIRDSNFSTLITCGILFYFGSSIIKGFAFNLAAGILVSMFTAITITKTLLGSFVGKKISENLQAFGANPNKQESKFDFIKRTKTWFSASLGIITVSIIAFFAFGFNLGLDFTGGTLMEFKFTAPLEKTQLVNTLGQIQDEINSNKEAPKANTETSDNTATIEESTIDEKNISADTITILDLKSAQVLSSQGNSYIIKSKYIDSATHDTVISKMKEKLPEFQELRFTTIGPVLGTTLLHKAVIAIIFALIMIIIYVAIAFRKIPKEVSPWRFGATAIVALIHDVVIVTGVFVILGQFLDVELDALFITALLTVFGYSVNDTIVIFDRLREHLIRNQHNETIDKIANRAMNQTLTRSINTSLSTILALVAVLFFGSPSIFYFILALTLGILVGTYSSIFIAPPLLVLWTQRSQKKQQS